MRSRLLFRLAICALPLIVAACEDSDLFAEKKTPLSGDRKALFPTGVPGVDYTAPPAQPSNSNIPLDTPVSNMALGEGQTNQNSAQDSQKQSSAKTKSRNQPAPRSTARSNDSSDPWADARSTAN